MEKIKRPSDVNQQIAKSVRVQLPRDGSKDGNNQWQSGQLPKGGYTSVWRFDGNRNTKDSSTSKPGNAGGGRIC
jgi:hypothetical protein